VCFVRKVFTMDRIPRLESNEEKLRNAVIQKYKRGTPFNTEPSRVNVFSIRTLQVIQFPARDVTVYRLPL